MQDHRYFTCMYVRFCSFSVLVASLSLTVDSVLTHRIVRAQNGLKQLSITRPL